MLDKLMVQQQLKAPYKRWKHMVAVMCLNLTYRKQVKTVLPLLESDSDDMCHLSQSLEFEFLVNFNDYDCLQYDCLLNTAH